MLNASSANRPWRLRQQRAFVVNQGRVGSKCLAVSEEQEDEQEDKQEDEQEDYADTNWTDERDDEYDYLYTATTGTRSLTSEVLH